jgi:hypothetical protein
MSNIWNYLERKGEKMYNTKFNKSVNKIGAVQGDVPLRKIAALPPDARPRKDNNNIVALGEVTGHHHIVETAQMYEDGLGNLFALVEKSTRLLHHEHGAIILDPGVYQFGLNGVQQVEYDGSEERRMLD